MPSTLIHAVVSLPRKSNIPEDAVVNTFNFLSNGDDLSGDRAQIGAALEAFYTDAAGTLAIETWLGTVLSEAVDGCTIKFYQSTDFLDPVVFGSPKGVHTFELDVQDETLPSEVAVCLSYHADLTDVPEEVANLRPAASHRGRVYIGPIAKTAVAIDAVTKEPGVAAGLVNDVCSAAAVLLDTMNGVGGNPQWVVWSRKAGALYPVVGGWVDNAFDSQRRRGNAPTARTLWVSA